MNRRGLVMAKKRFTKSALWNDQTTDHPQQKRTSFPFKRSGRTDVWPLPAERLQQAAFKPLREKVLISGPRDRRSSLCFMMLQKIAGGGDFVKKQILRGDRNLSKLLRDESHREAVAFFFRRFFCFQVVLRRSILIPRRLGEHALQS